MPDMLVNLYELKDNNHEQKLLERGITIKRPLSPDKSKILQFIRDNFSDGWANEAEYALFNNPITCYIAVRGEEIVAFACYDTTAKNFFGPIGIKESERGSGIGSVLLRKCLFSMKENGYAYAIIGGPTDAIEFYEKAVNATIIENSVPGIYRNMISSDW